MDPLSPNANLLLLLHLMLQQQQTNEQQMGIIPPFFHQPIHNVSGGFIPPFVQQNPPPNPVELMPPVAPINSNLGHQNNQNSDKQNSPIPSTSHYVSPSPTIAHCSPSPQISITSPPYSPTSPQYSPAYSISSPKPTSSQNFPNSPKDSPVPSNEMQKNGVEMPEEIAIIGEKEVEKNANEMAIIGEKVVEKNANEMAIIGEEEVEKNANEMAIIGEEVVEKNANEMAINGQIEGKKECGMHYCTKCEIHHKIQLRRQHFNCPFRLCPCKHCEIINETRKVHRQLCNLRNAQMKKLSKFEILLLKGKRLCQNCRNHDFFKPKTQA
jgi:hypothetical protein